MPLEVAENSDALLPISDDAPHEYTVTARGLPTIAELNAIDTPANRSGLSADLIVPELPRELISFLATFQGGYWQRFDAWRNWVLDNVTAARLGEVSETPASRLREIFAQRRATPFELVALQVVGARWMGIPTRLVWGYDGGTEVRSGVIRVDTDLNAAFFMEAHFGSLGWVPVVGTPRNADGNDC